jgi:hypothetical protein
LFYSAQLDGQAEEAEQTALQRHLRECAACRRHAAEMRSLRADLRSLAAPRSIPTLAGEVQVALRVEAQARANEARRREDRIDLWRMRLFSQGIGAAISICLFFFVITGVFRPAYRTLLAQAVTDVTFEDPTIRLKLLLWQPPPPPIFAPNGDLLSVGASLSGDEEIIATVKVQKNGHASINQIVAPSSDPSVMDRFSNGITQASFKPTRPDQNTSSDAVVILSKVNITARASI